ncbi:ran-specific GTPase-activating protein 1 [Plasmodium brasilianum]|uniref:Ran binding protein 1, putative n=2 Tax=Plasmodium (Plasmodium) TaxID=418103 RepID=A0A1A8VW81_PLAMA|nr:ran binding protein 1, putative [Plasmodium malariae]KAI4840149.1 ran-specific GTPase-activating protein 1 [Plasmodium brasilianum]SBS83093.1 ran binding protein 1, putative [Plasmodium malariae]SBT87509.1 ran binding protein 1, putative [Plasmodium malariae]
MDDEKNDYNPEEEVTTGNWNTPKIELKEVEIKTGEEDESLYWSGRSKLYRWVDGEWKERGLGESKLLLHKKKGIIRFLLRQEKTLKVVANHYIYPNESYCKLVPNAGSEKIYAWTVKDFAEEPKIEQFALKFNTAEAAKLFKQKFDEAGKVNLKLLDDKGELKEKHEKTEEKNIKEEKEENGEAEETGKMVKEDTKEESKEKKKDDEKENKKEDDDKTTDEKKNGMKEDKDKKNEENDEKEEANKKKDNDDKNKNKTNENKEGVKLQEKDKENSKNDDKKKNEEDNIKRES